VKRNGNKKINLFFRSFLSSSGSGKSTLVRKALASLAKDCPVVLVNVRADEVTAYKKAHKNTVATEASCLSEAIANFIPGGYVVIEDIIDLAKKEERTLRKLLNFDAHHNGLRVVCVAHLLYRTSLLSLVSLFNFVTFTLNNAGRALIKQAATFSFYLEPSKSTAWVAGFSKACKKWGEHGGCVYISCMEVKIYHRTNDNVSSQLEGTGEEEDEINSLPRDDQLSSSQSNSYSSGAQTKRTKRCKPNEPREGSHSQLIERFASCFKGHEQCSTAVSIFSIVANVIANEASFRSFDLTFSFRQRRTPHTVKRISLVDYIDSLIDARPLSPASRDFKVLHRYLSERCKIPLLFVLNPHFRLRSGEEESSNVEDDNSNNETVSSNVSDDDDDNDDDVNQDAASKFPKRRVGQKMETMGN